MPPRHRNLIDLCGNKGACNAELQIVVITIGAASIVEAKPEASSIGAKDHQGIGVEAIVAAILRKAKLFAGLEVNLLAAQVARIGCSTYGPQKLSSCGAKLQAILPRRCC